MQHLPIASPDPIPLPGPVWLLRTLLLLTFFLHLVAMDLALGGSLLAVFYRLRRKSEFARQTARDLAAKLPVMMAYTITLGVAALLFVQVLYGNFLYASSILIGIPWASVIVLLILAYYGFYYAAMHDEAGAGVRVVGALAALLLLAIAFIYVNNMTLMLTPGRWIALYRRHVSGWNLNLGERALIPRYLHMLTAAIALCGLFVVLSGIRQRTTQFGQWLIRQGAAWFAGATVVNYGFGLWLLLSLPARIRALVLGANGVATVLFGAALFLSLAAVVHALMLRAGRRPVANASVCVATALAAVALMVVIRDYVRNGYLPPGYQFGQLRVVSQTSIIVLFFVLFAAGLATVYYMLSKVAAARPAGDPASARQQKA